MNENDQTNLPSTGFDAILKTARNRHMRDYALAGFAFFPLAHDRTPFTTGWRKAKIDPLFDPDDFDGGYGITLTDYDFVLDYDPRRDVDGVQLKSLWAKLQLPITKTYMVRTGRGGFHIYFKKPPQIKVRSVVPGFPAIEIKTEGRYVIGPGSPHPQGVPYTVERSHVGAILEIPANLLAFCSSTVSARGELIDSLPGDQEIIIEADDELTRQRYIRFLKLDSTKNKGCYVVACEGKVEGLPASTTFMLMMEHYNDARQGSPKTYEEMEAKVTHAYKYSQEKQGSRHALANEYSLPKTEIESEIENEHQDDLALAETDRRHKYNTLIRARYDFKGKGLLDASMNNGVCMLRQIPHDKTDNYPATVNPLYKLLRFNMFNNRIEFTRHAPWHNHQEPFPRYWQNIDALLLKDWFASNKPYCASKDIMHEIANVIANDHRYHPIKDWLNGLVWDGHDRLDGLLPTYAGAPNTDYEREVGKNTIIAAVARIFQPGCQHDSMLVLEGPQETGKTTFTRILGGDHYAAIKIEVDSVNSYVRTVASMRFGWFIEAAEMEVSKKASREALKAFITQREDIVRLAFEPVDSIIPRRSVMVGTVNPTDAGYLRDTTGNRRFWPVVTTVIDLVGLARDRDQLFAEAVSRYRKGEAWHIISPELKERAKSEQARRLEVDERAFVIGDWLDRGSNVPDELTTVDIAYLALNIAMGKFGRLEQMMVNDCMHRLGYHQKQKWSGQRKKTVRVWVKGNEQKQVDWI